MNLKKDYWKNLKENDFLTIKNDLSIIFRRNSILRKIKHKKGTFLDLGCGIEFFLYDGLDGFDRVGLDLAMSSFQQMQINKPAFEKGRFVIADAAKLPFKNNTFDVVMSSNSFDHVSSPVDCIKEIYRILKPGGEFVVCVPSRLNGGLSAHKHIYDVYTPEKFRDISKNYFYLESFEYIMFFYGLIWAKVLFLLNSIDYFCHKISLNKKIRKNLYESKLYANFCRVFKTPFNLIDILFSKFILPQAQSGYLLAKFVKHEN